MRQLRWYWTCVLLRLAADGIRNRKYPSLNRIADDVDRIRFDIERLRREYRTEAEEFHRPQWDAVRERSSGKARSLIQDTNHAASDS